MNEERIIVKKAQMIKFMNKSNFEQRDGEKVLRID